MSVISTLSNHFKKQVLSKLIDLSEASSPADSFKVILMNTAFAFNKDTHATLADVISSPSAELATNYGYTQQNKALTGGTLTEDDANDKGYRTFDNVTWTASGGDIGPTGCAIVYDDTTSDDTVVGCIDFGADITIPNGSSLQLQAIQISLT
jgi:hypothetical protein